MDQPRFSPRSRTNGRAHGQHVRRELLREVNDRIRDVSEGFQFPEGGLEFVCECGAEGCEAMVGLFPADYDRIRQDTGAVLAGGHETAQG